MTAAMDPVALLAGGSAAAITWFLAARVFRPFPPGTVVGDLPEKSLRGFVMQVAAGNLQGERTMYMHFDWIRQHGRKAVIGHRVFHLHRVLVSDPKDVEHILVKREKGFTKSSEYELLQQLLGEGLVTLIDNELHAHARKVCNPAFAAGAVRRIAEETIGKHGLAMLRAIESAEAARTGGNTTSCGFEVDMRQVLHKTALNVIAEAAFHTDDDAATKVVADSCESALSNGFNLLRFLPLMNRLPTAANLKADGAIRTINTFTAEKAADIRRELYGSDGGDAAQLMSEEERESFINDGKGVALLDYMLLDSTMNNKALSDHCMTFLFAGHESTAQALHWLLLLVGRAPEVQQRLAEELECVCGLGVAPSLDDVRNCEYLECVITETLRLYPSAPLLGRTPIDDLEVLPSSKIVVERGATLVVNIMAMQRNPGVYGANADEFVPARWEGAAGMDLRLRAAPCHFMPFSLGSRNCIGKELAMAELLVFTAMIFRNYGVTFPDEYPFPTCLHQVSLKPNNPHPFVLTKRVA